MHLAQPKSWENPQSCFSPLLTPPQPPDYCTSPNPRARLLIDFQHPSLPPRTNFQTQTRYNANQRHIPPMYNNNITVSVWSGDLPNVFHLISLTLVILCSLHNIFVDVFGKIRFESSFGVGYMTAYKAVEVYKIVLLSFNICYKRKIKEIN